MDAIHPSKERMKIVWKTIRSKVVLNCRELFSSGSPRLSVSAWSSNIAIQKGSVIAVKTLNSPLPTINVLMTAIEEIVTSYERRFGNTIGIAA